MTAVVPQPGAPRVVTDFSVEEESARFEAATPEERLAFAVERFGDGLLMTSSFGESAAILLHMWSRVAAGRPVVFIDTGFLFDETHAYQRDLAARFGLNVRVVRPAVPRAVFLAANGEDIMVRDPDACCAHNKVAPLEPLLEEATAWVSGLRRDQSRTRAHVPIFERTDKGKIKVYPLATMTAEQADRYRSEHAIPEHPLRARRYLSIGCEPCTRPVEDGEDARAGRWAGTGKTECGLHSPRRPRKETAA